VTTVPQQALFLMNSPIVIELARRLVAMPEFVDQADDPGRLNFLYERIYQRPPSTQETELGLEFVTQTPLREDVSAVPNNDGGNQFQRKNGGGGNQGQRDNRKRLGGNGGKSRAPLTSWEEYAQALLQANETSFVN
jgi:hypothetical protein